MVALGYGDGEGMADTPEGEVRETMRIPQLDTGRNWLAETLADLLVAQTDRARNVASFTQTFFTQFAKLTEASFHPKWQEVNLTADLPGWKRYPR